MPFERFPKLENVPLYQRRLYAMLEAPPEQQKEIARDVLKSILWCFEKQETPDGWGIEIRRLPFKTFLRLFLENRESKRRRKAGYVCGGISERGAFGMLDPEGRESRHLIYTIVGQYSPEERIRASIHEVLHILFEKESTIKKAHEERIFQAEEIIYQLLSAEEKEIIWQFIKTSREPPFERAMQNFIRKHSRDVKPSD